MKISCVLNGATFETDAPASMSLADMLREKAGLRSVHLGCEQGVCGACTILLDGRTVRSCLMIAPQANGRSVTTAEGVPAERSDSWGEVEATFVDKGAFQCGFCTSGMVVCLEELLALGQPVTLEAVRHRLSGQICRCTGYAPILQAFAEILERSGLLLDEPASSRPGAGA